MPKHKEIVVWLAITPSGKWKSFPREEDAYKAHSLDGEPVIKRIPLSGTYVVFE